MLGLRRDDRAGVLEVGVRRLVGLVRRGPRRRRATANSSRPTPAPTDARRNRDASPCSSNCHQSSFEYSTCLNAKRPSQIDAPSAPATATTPAGREPRVEERGAAIERRPRAPAGRAGRTPAASPPRSPRPSAATRRCRGDRADASGVGARRGAGRAPATAAAARAPTMLPRKCDASMTPSGTRAIEQRQAPGRRGRRAGEQQHDAREEREDRQHARRQLLASASRTPRRRARGLRAALADLVGDEDDERDDERQQVVDRAVRR